MLNNRTVNKGWQNLGVWQYFIKPFIIVLDAQYPSRLCGETVYLRKLLVNIPRIKLFLDIILVTFSLFGGPTRFTTIMVSGVALSFDAH